VWLDFRAPHRHLVVDLKVTNARTSTNIPHTSARLPLPGSLALGAQHSKLDANLRLTWHTFRSVCLLLLSLRHGGWGAVGAYGGRVG
jgi:hypothetical protein